ncbi:MAG: hypothetical protein AAFR96_06380 [Planctomycetota bacterium]
MSHIRLFVACCLSWLSVCGSMPSSAQAMEYPYAVLPSPQRDGDPEKGRDYLLNGGYIGAGIPLPLWRALHAFAPPPDRLIDRPGVDPSVPIDMNQYQSARGIEVVSGVNCLGCHATEFRGEYVIGLGNASRDWTRGPQPMNQLGAIGNVLLAGNEAAREELRLFIEGASSLAGTTDAPVRGANPAFRFEEVTAAFRDPETLERVDEPVFAIGPDVTWSDVPPLWNLKKKASLYYNGMGRGDFARLIQQIGMVLIEDADEAASIEPGMRDVMAYLKTLEPPAFPESIDGDLAQAGAAIFNSRCATCHGTYGDYETYPNLIIPLQTIGTDPVYAETLYESGLIPWFNRSWFAQDGVAEAVPELGYVAPPLDGVWATAPYFHNGSVPTLAGVLDSQVRPDRWTRSFKTDESAYDLANVGWVHSAVSEEDAGAADTQPGVFDMRRRGFGNGGHTFADDLSNRDRRALLEYLKTL